MKRIALLLLVLLLTLSLLVSCGAFYRLSGKVDSLIDENMEKTEQELNDMINSSLNDLNNMLENEYGTEDTDPPANDPNEHMPPLMEELDMSEVSLSKASVTEEETDYVLISAENYGDILVRLYSDVAPDTVANFKKLVSKGFYDGLTFHRVIENFMIQGGCPNGDGTGNAGATIKGEFSNNGFENNLLHVRGVISMARSYYMNSASCQFFIMHKTSPHLDGSYAAFGCVVDGMDVVDRIATTDTDYYDAPLETIRISSIRFASVEE